MPASLNPLLFITAGQWRVQSAGISHHLTYNYCQPTKDGQIREAKGSKHCLFPSSASSEGFTESLHSSENYLFKIMKIWIVKVPQEFHIYSFKTQASSPGRVAYVRLTLLPITIKLGTKNFLKKWRYYKWQKASRNLMDWPLRDEKQRRWDHV